MPYTHARCTANNKQQAAYICLSPSIVFGLLSLIPGSVCGDISDKREKVGDMLAVLRAVNMSAFWRDFPVYPVCSRLSGIFIFLFCKTECRRNIHSMRNPGESQK